MPDDAARERALQEAREQAEARERAEQVRQDAATRIRQQQEAQRGSNNS